MIRYFYFPFCFLVLAGVLFWVSDRLEPNNRGWLKADNSHEKDNQTFLDTFDQQDNLLVIVETKGFFEINQLQSLQKLVNQLEDISFADQVSGRKSFQFEVSRLLRDLEKQVAKQEEFAWFLGTYQKWKSGKLDQREFIQNLLKLRNGSRGKLSQMAAELLEKLDFKFIKKIRAPVNLPTIFSNPEQLTLETFFESLESGHIKDVAEFKHAFLASPYARSFLSKDQTSFAIDISFKRGLSYGEQQVAVASLKAKLDEFLSSYQLIGNPYVESIINFETIRNLGNMLIYAILIIAGTLLLFFRSVKVLLVIITPALLSATMGLWSLSKGYSISSIDVILPLVLFVISLSDSTHIFCRWRYCQNEGGFKQLWRQVSFPCFVTSLTTWIGFVSFGFSEVEPLKNLAIQASYLIPIAFMITLLGTIIGLKCFPNSGRNEASVAEKSLYGAKFFRFHPLATGVIILSAIVAVFFLSKTQYQSNFLDVFFSKKHSLQRSALSLDRSFNGSGSIEIVLQGKQGRKFDQMDNFKQLISLKTDLETVDGVIDAQSMNLPIQMLHEKISTTGESLPSDSDALAQELLFLEFSRNDNAKDVLSEYTNSDYSAARISLRTRKLNTLEFDELITKVKQKIEPLNQNYELVLTGGDVLFNGVSNYVLKTQATSILICLGVIAILFLGYFGFKLTLILLAVNVVPLLITTATIVFCKIPFDFSTVLITAISFGICVDSSSHLAHLWKHFSKSQNKVKSQQEIVLKAINQCIKPFLVTTVLLVLGFGVFAFSDLVVLHRFGIFVVYSFIWAFICDAVVLPLWINYWMKRTQKNA